MKISDIGKILTNKLGDSVDMHIFDGEEEISFLLTDSRNHFTPNHTLFFAIKTKGGNDGHKYIKSLYEKGVRNFIVEDFPLDIEEFKNVNFIKVPDSIEALTVVGGQNRHFAKEILAITGSRGKTTIKEIIFELMEPYKRISRSPRSFNSKIGVPLSLWQISADSDLAIIEAGISQKGEMKVLSDIIGADTVIFTNIGEAHAKGFESMEEKTREKSLLAFNENVKTVIYPSENQLLRRSLHHLEGKKEMIGWTINPSKIDNSDSLLIINYDEGHVEYKWRDIKGNFDYRPEKDFDIENIAGALAFMLKEKIKPEEIQKRFESLHRINTRLNVTEGINRCSLILDSYTSDLSSLLPAIDFLKRRKMPYQSPTLIISDLHHEGHSLSSTYKEMAQIIKETGVAKFIGIGESLMSNSHLFPEDSRFYSSTDEFINNLSAADFNDEIILLKGSPEFKFHKILELLEAKKHETVLEVNLDAILRNYNYFRSNLPSSTGIIAMVKASGYGTGSYEIAKTLQDAGASYLAVAALDEGIDLRNNGIIMPIMVMNPRAANYWSLFKNRLEPVVYSMPMLEELAFAAGKFGIGDYPVHIKLDTGMHRMGFQEIELNELIQLLERIKGIKVSSIFSHLATADCLDMDEYTYQQFERFQRMSDKILNSLKYPIKRHILNSAGIIRFPEFHYDLVRLGIGLYGANTLPYSIEKPLSPVATLRSVIICIREIDGEEAVGYSRKGVIKGKTRIATVPIGYADGMNRRFGNGNLNLLVNGRMVPTIGNICMDATMIDVSGVECKEGDSVEIFGENISIQTLADILGTIPYEILTSVSPRVKRIYYRE